MNFRVILCILALVCLFVPMTASAAQTGSLTTGINQTLADGSVFAGTLTTTGFQVINGVVNAVGTITGTLTSSTGAVIGTLTNAPINLPLTGMTGSCQILSLHIGRIDLTLLGLNVNLSPIDLVITAQQGPGNLLGNLLCAVAHLLDSNAAPTAIANLLNHILHAL